MFEVIWSYAQDCYIVRPVKAYNRIAPLFMGSHDECVAWLSKHTSQKAKANERP